MVGIDALHDDPDSPEWRESRDADPSETSRDLLSLEELLGSATGSAVLDAPRESRCDRRGCDVADMESRDVLW